MMITAIISMIIITFYDLYKFSKQAGIVMEVLILIYFFVYVIIDGCYSFNGGYLKTVWLYIDYILISIFGFILLIIRDIDYQIYIEDGLTFDTVYNIVNTLAMILLFVGIIYEKRVFMQLKKGRYRGWDNNGSGSSGGNENGLQGSDLGTPSGNSMNTPSDNRNDFYDSDTNMVGSPLEHLDFASSDMISLVDD